MTWGAKTIATTREAMELTEGEKVVEVKVSGEMLRVLRAEEEEKAGWKVVARDNKKRKVDEVVVTPLGPKEWAVGKGKAGKVVVSGGVLDMVPKGPRSLRQYMKAETGGQDLQGLGIGLIGSPIPKAPRAMMRRGRDTEGWDRGCLQRRHQVGGYVEFPLVVVQLYWKVTLW
ncbi:hypothetical protein HOY82DRAFT_538147 [Tuber indicum]|nr:hypothetical protein HOY82DRAFT_538147 [Tuber indicum]